MKQAGWIVIAFFAIAIGLYPLAYFLADMSLGLLANKSPEVLASTLWRGAFYQHIVFGGITLLTGWSQFIPPIRNKYIGTHRTLGKIYLISVLLSGIASLYLALFATGGIVTSMGFGSLAILWLITSTIAYRAIRRKDLTGHRNWMIRSYALTFAAVTLRLWLPILGIAFQIDFDISYKIISFLCWVPNLMVAELIIFTNRKNFSHAL